MATKIDLDLRTARTTKVPQRVVTQVTTAFFEELKAALVRDGEVYLPGVGRLKVASYRGSSTNLTTGNGKKGVRTGKRRVENPVHLKVFFKKSPTLRAFLRRGMR